MRASELLLYNFAAANVNIEDELMFRVLKSIIMTFDIEVNEIILELLQKGINQENTRSETLELAVNLIENFEDKSIFANIFTVEIKIDLLFEFIDYFRNELIEQILQTSIIPFTKEKYDDIIIITIGKIHRLPWEVPAEMIYNALKDVSPYIDMNVYITILQKDNIEIFYQQILEFHHSLLSFNQ